MNIFKILSSGDQKLKEPAVTSFLAYLLDPYETHGLKTKFLEYILKPVVEEKKFYDKYKNLVVKVVDKKNKNEVIKIKSNLIYEFNFNVDIEVSKYLLFEEFDNISSEKTISKKRNDIDIVIIISNKENEDEKYTFIIENKINDGAISKNGNQLEKQLKSYLNELEEIDLEEIDKKNICSIFLTPNSTSSDNYFKAFEDMEDYKSTPKYHHYWKGSILVNRKVLQENTNTDNTEDINGFSNKKLSTQPIAGIYYFLNDILSKESVGLIEPLQDYTKHTIKAFMNFIDSGFKSRSDEKDEDGKWQKDIYLPFAKGDFKGFEDFKLKYNEKLDNSSWETLIGVKDKILKLNNDAILIRFSKTHLLVCIYKGKRILALSKNSAPKRKFSISLPKNLRNSSFEEEQKSLMKELKCIQKETKEDKNWNYFIDTDDSVSSDQIIELLKKIIDLINS